MTDFMRSRNVEENRHLQHLGNNRWIDPINDNNNNNK